MPETSRIGAGAHIDVAVQEWRMRGVLPMAEHR